MRRPLRSRQSLNSELHLVIRAARLRFQDGLSQDEIADRMNASQSTVSRWLQRAEDEGILQVRIRVPQVIDLQDRLRQALPEFREVRVMPAAGPRSKNVDNLGAGAAELLVAEILRLLDRKRSPPTKGRRTIGITLSSGETLRKVVEDFIALLRDDPALRLQFKKALLKFYPAAFFWDVQLHGQYPATLVTVLWTEVKALLGEDCVQGFAPVIPRSFYTDELWKPAQRAVRDRSLAEWGIEEVKLAAERADIFVLGIGTLDEQAYPQILKPLGIDAQKVCAGHGLEGEMIYVPVRDGAPRNAIEPRVVRVSREELQAAARDPERLVIGVGGGEHKCVAIGDVLAARPHILNAIVTDTTVAESYLGQLSVTDAATASPRR